MRVSQEVAWLIPVLLGFGCENGQRSPDPTGAAPAELNEDRIEIDGQRMTSGFQQGRLRFESELQGFAISQYPISVGQYESCQAAGACSPIERACSNFEDGSDSEAVTCVEAKNAETYCSWSGGRLPTLDEWLLAVRGREPQRFAWGNTLATCEQHPMAKPSRSKFRKDEETFCGKRFDRRLRTKKHAEGAAESGVEDVLIAGGELLRSDDATKFAVCSGEKSHCLVYGQEPGAIDSVRRILGDAQTEGSADYEMRIPVEPEAINTFRCVWEEESER